MGLISSSMHVGNASSRTVRGPSSCRKEVRVREIDASLTLAGPPFSLDASLKAKLDRSLDVTGFVRIASHEALEFALPRGSFKQVGRSYSGWQITQEVRGSIPSTDVGKETGL